MHEGVLKSNAIVKVIHVWGNIKMQLNEANLVKEIKFLFLI